MQSSSCKDVVSGARRIDSLTFDGGGAPVTAPLRLSFDSTPPSAVLAGLERAGILVVPCRQGTCADKAQYICRRGWVSFALSAYPGQDPDELLVSFTADLSRWRWWNFPILWLASIPLTPWEIRLQRDAYEALRALGAKWLGGGKFVVGESDPDADVGKVD
jgi:hypothetical protein